MENLKQFNSKSQKNSSKKTSELTLQKEICQRTFKEMATFYNSKQDEFKAFEDEFQINVWFLNHFRTYMSYRNEVLGKINTNKTTVKKHKIIYRICKDILFVLSKYVREKNTQSDYLVISNYSDQVRGKNKRFGKLEQSFDSLHNRRLLDIKKPISRKSLSTNKKPSSDSIFLKYLFKFTFIYDLIQFNKGLKQLKKQISKSHLNPIEKRINSYFWKNNSLFYICFLRFKSFDFFFKNNVYKGILMSDENSPQQKAIQYAAQANSVKVFAFQHGNIHELHPAYMYGDYKSKPSLADITFCWGDSFTELLKNKGGYPSNQVETVGRIPFKNNHLGLSHSLKGIDNILLYASQPQRDEALRHKLLKDILVTCKTLKTKYTLVIRPHPNEKTDAFFNQVAEEVDYFNFIIDRQSDLDSHFKACKVFVVAFSTVGTEFIPHYKPMLVLDYYKQDLVGFIKNGVGIPIRNQTDLIEELSKSKLEINKENYKKFIERYYDTGEHVIDKIKQFIYEN